MNPPLSVKIISIVLPGIILIILAIKKTELSGFFEKAGLFGIFLFALFIPIKHDFAIFGMVTAIIFFIAYKIAKRDISIPKTDFNIPILIYTGIVIASFLWTRSIKDSIDEGGEVVYFVMFFFAAAGFLRTKKRIDFMVYIFTFAISVAIVYSLYPGFFINILHIGNANGRLLGNESLWNRDGGSFINAIYTHNRLAGPAGNWASYPIQVSYGIVVIIAYYMMDFGKQNKGSKNLPENLPHPRGYLWPSFLFAILILIGFIDIIFAKTRSAWLGIIAAISVLMYLKSKRLFLSAVILIFALNIGVFFISKTFKNRIIAMFNPKIYKTELKTHGDIESHIALIKSAWTVFERFPLTGVGVGAFSRYFDEHKGVRFPWYFNPKTGKKLYASGLKTPESGYMQTLAETGIFSFLALMWLFFIALKRPLKLYMNSDDKFKRKVAVMTIAVSIVFYGSFAGVSNMSSDDITNLWLFFLALFAAANSLPERVSANVIP
ncbi:MAG: O-antigen ligase family protein [bacterium]